MPSSDNCVLCHKTVRPRQEGLECDICQKWQHRTCNSGVSRADYRRMVRGEYQLYWSCHACTAATHEPDNPHTPDQPTDDDALTDGSEELDQQPMDDSLTQEQDHQPMVDSTTHEHDQQPMDDSLTHEHDQQPMDDSTTHEHDQQPMDDLLTHEHDQQPMDNSFNLSRSFAEVEPHQEDSLPLDSSLDIEPAPEQPTTYHEVNQGSKRGNKKLVDSRGYSYTVLKSTSKGDKVFWRCIKRGKMMNCPATVIQTGDTYTDGSKQHIHSGEPGILTSVEIRAEAKSRARENVFTISAPRIATEVIGEHADTDLPEHSRPKQHNIVRAINRVRQSTRPKDPQNLDSELYFHFLDTTTPGFFLKDFSVDGRRHVIFATDHQLELLAKTRTWYMDATFRVVNAPWTQLFSIHGFVKSGDSMKQMPLVFRFMSGKRTQDYYEVLRRIDHQLPDEIRLERFVVDFEAAVWQVIYTRFPDKTVKGCAFHWSQAVFRKVQELGLQTTYNKKGAMYEFVKQVMSLPFLPTEQIHEAFIRLQDRATSPALTRVMEYISKTWIRNRTFPIESWSIYMTSIRTNNDVEGWHNRLNTRVNSHEPVPFYLLIHELFREASSIPLQVKMVSEGKLARFQRKQSRNAQKGIFALWGKYADGHISTTQLMRKVGRWLH